MPTAVYFLGNQSGTPKGQVQLNALMSFSLCPSLVCSGRHLSTRCTMIKKQSWMFFCQCQLNPPYLLSTLGCIFKIRAPFLTQFFPWPTLHLPSLLCHLLFALTATVTVSCACHLLPEYYKAVIIGHFENYSYKSKTFSCCQGWI